MNEVKSYALGTWFSRNPEESVKRLWQVSEEASGVKFSF